MNHNIQQLREKIYALETEIETALHEQSDQLIYRLKGRRVLFEEGIKEQHRQLKTRWYRWFADTELRHLLSAPFVYGMIVPMVLLDVFLLVFQQVCFRLYRIPRAVRADYVVLDRHRLAYLNLFEKINCAYCGYGNGLFAYAGEIASRTEQYWCPIKHARRAKDTRPRYANFVDYGDAESYRESALTFRKTIGDEKNSVDQKPDLNPEEL
ncbi:MAG: hypothetical protein KBT63_05860 [Porticoccaceae bacterium]|nr:hypothetical protein [Porticoccaceae bacterium]